MAFSISNQSFYDILQKVYPIIPLKSSLQILSNFKISYQNEQLEITATDLDQSIRIITNVSGDTEPFDVTANARRVFEIVRELPDGQVTVSVEDNVINFGTERNFKCKIAGADTGDFPGFPEINGGTTFEINSALLKTMIPKSSFAAAKDESRACLAGILWENHPSKTGMIATDGHRLGSCFINGAFPVKEKFSSIVSPKSLNHLVRIIGEKNSENIRVTVNEKYMIFSAGSFVLCTKLIDGPYPDYNKVIPTNNPKEAIIDRASLLNAIRRAMVLSNQKTHLVKFSFAENTLEVAVVNKEIGGEAKEKIPIEYHGDPHQIGFNAQYFNEIIDIAKTPKIKLQMNTQISACLIFPVYEKEKEKPSDDLFLLMPLRIMEM
ncbi:MAG: DNA polymerase III subunit beta [Chitinispirillaceae bacterium]|jgi:DNA polymerase-3 subunit beta